VKGKLVGFGIQRGDGLAGGAVEGAGVDDPFAVELLVAGYVGVAMKDVIDIELSQGGAETGFMTVKNGEALAIEFKPDRNLLGNRQTQRLRVRQQAVLWKIHVAPHEGERTTHHFVEDFGAANIAAMDDMRNAQLVKDGNCLSHGQVTTVAVRENAD